MTTPSNGEGIYIQKEQGIPTHITIPNQTPAQQPTSAQAPKIVSIKSSFNEPPKPY